MAFTSFLISWHLVKFSKSETLETGMWERENSFLFVVPESVTSVAADNRKLAALCTSNIRVSLVSTFYSFCLLMSL